MKQMLLAALRDTETTTCSVVITGTVPACWRR